MNSVYFERKSSSHEGCFDIIPYFITRRCTDINIHKLSTGVDNPNNHNTKLVYINKLEYLWKNIKSRIPTANVYTPVDQNYSQFTLISVNQPIVSNIAFKIPKLFYADVDVGWNDHSWSAGQLFPSFRGFSVTRINSAHKRCQFTDLPTEVLTNGLYGILMLKSLDLII